MDEVGKVTILSLLLTGLIFSGVFLGLYTFMGDMQNNYGGTTTQYETNASTEAKESIEQAGQISNDLKESMETQEFSGDNIIDLIFGGLFNAFRNLLTTVPIVFTGMVTTTTSTLGLPIWVQTMVSSAIIIAVVFVIARLVFKGGRLE